MKSYTPAIITDKKAVKQSLKQFLNEFPGPKTIHNAVVYVQADKRVSERVDGNSIMPILQELLKTPVDPFVVDSNPVQKTWLDKLTTSVKNLIGL